MNSTLGGIHKFWKELISARSSLLKIHMRTAVNDILSEPLWYNNQSHDPRVFCKDWARQGILQIRDPI